MRVKRYARIAAGTVLAVCLASQAYASGSPMADNNMLQELKRMLEQQQAQIDRQAAEIQALKEQLKGNDEKIAGKADKQDLDGADKLVSSSFTDVNVSLYGHINRALLYGNNGDSSNWYSVDNTNSQTRLGLKAAVDTTSGWQVGGRIEYGIVSNGSSDVNQEQTYNATDDNFKLRWADLSFKESNFGKISLGKGSSATDGSAEYDLSGTSIAAYNSIGDMAGSMLWYDNDTNTRTTIRIKDVYSNFDGLGRTDRIRYDTPSLAGLSAAFSASSGHAFDGALIYSRDYGGTKVATAIGIANPGNLNRSTDVQYSGSASVLLASGLNFSFSAGSRELDDDIVRDNPFSWWGKLGYKTKFYDGTTTAFSVDYGQTENLRADDDTAKSFSVAAVHNVADWGTEFYMIYRNHQLDADGYDFDSIDTFMAGARVKF
ncbi:MAG: hypothetical protein D6B25_15540 [Desulfobulbaceae bacterium]|nr:MAG: hypothetical protein D6B25_15540 [Desulfobulbaceae bacterium]